VEVKHDPEGAEKWAELIRPLKKVGTSPACLSEQIPLTELRSVALDRERAILWLWHASKDLHHFGRGS